jgi:Anti-sigma-K factor rskA
VKRGEPRSEIEEFRAQELLLLRATEGLTEAQAAELAALGADDDDSYDLAAAALELSFSPPHLQHELPAHLAQRIWNSAAAALPRPAPSARARTASPAPGHGQAPAAPLAPTDSPSPQGHHGPQGAMTAPGPTGPSAQINTPETAAPVIPLAPRRSRASGILAWTIAAAGFAAAAGAILWAARQEPEVIVQRVEVPVPPEPAPPPLTPTAARAKLLAEADDVQTLPWTATTDPAAKGATGDVVWSPSRQEGYLRFVGVAPNDPKAIQYQLWIFDKRRDDRFPVDGGVFDIGPGGEVVIKISPKLFVNEPVLFAITVEPPGGVVVSKRERIVVTAAPKTG